MVSGILRSYKANQAYVSNIYCGWWRLLFSLTMVFGYAGALRKNMVQILQNLSPFTSATPVRFAHCSGRGFTCVFERSARQRRFAPCVHTSPRPSTNTQKHISTTWPPLPRLCQVFGKHSTWYPLMSFPSWWISLILLQECWTGNWIIMHGKFLCCWFSLWLLLSSCCFFSITSSNTCNTRFISQQVQQLLIKNRFGGATRRSDHCGSVVHGDVWWTYQCWKRPMVRMVLNMLDFCSFPNLFQEFKISHKIIEFFVTNVPSVNIIVSNSNIIVKSAI